MKLLSYHNDPAIKSKFVERFAAHRAIDAVIQGTGYEKSYQGLGRGCFVGCTLQSYNHARFPMELGWPVWLARLADAVFEGVPESEAPQFGTDLLDAVPVGVDLEPVRHQLAIRRLDRLITLQRGKLGKHGDAIDAVISQAIAATEVVRRCHEAELGGDRCDWSAAESAAESAESAESAARSAARSAAESAARSAESAAWSARSAARSAAESAESAAWSAESAAWSAAESAAWSAAESAESAESAAWSAAESAESAAYQQERDDLLDILRGLEAQQ